MNGIIVLDGPDGTGKTTLAQYFVEHHGAVYLHLSYKFKNSMAQYHTAMLLKAIDLYKKGHLVIIDRLWMSEYVYAKVFRGGSKIPHLGRLLDRIILKYSGIYVVCIPENTREYLDHYDTLKEVREEMYSTMLDVHHEYSKLWNKFQDQKWPHVFKYDLFTDGNDLPAYTDMLLEELRKHKELNELPEGAKINLLEEIQFTGSLGHGQLMFIDEKPTLRKGKPFFPRHLLDAGNNLLNGILEDMDVPEYKLMWSDITNEPLWRYLLSTFDIKPICLGVKAYQQIVKDHNSYMYYGQPDCHITPERHLDQFESTTFVGRMHFCLTTYLGESNE